MDSNPSELRYVEYLRKSSDDSKGQRLSLEKQERKILNYLNTHDTCIVGDFEPESRTAKEAGRPIFNEIMKMIQRGEADGIICWKPSRLSRNPVDTGLIMDLLERGIIKNLIFTDYDFSNTLEGRKALAKEFIDAEYYSKQLSVDVGDGEDEKRAQGWLPSYASFGYKNYYDEDLELNIVIPDNKANRFSLVKNAWDLVYSSNFSLAEVTDIAYDQWGLRTRKGKRISRSHWHRIFRNNFYYGYLKGAPNNMGKHKPMISKDVFDTVQKNLSKKGPGKRENTTTPNHPYRKIIKCGKCGHLITSENTTNRHGTTYAHYHCAARSQIIKCKEPSIELADLESHIGTTLGSINIPEKYLKWAENNVNQTTQKMIKDLELEIQRNQKIIDNNGSKLERLEEMRMEGMTKERFDIRKNEIDRENIGLLGQIEKSTLEIDKLKKLAVDSSNFTITLVNYYQKSDWKTKTKLLQKLANPCEEDGLVLLGGKISISLRHPFI